MFERFWKIFFIEYIDAYAPVMDLGGGGGGGCAPPHFPNMHNEESNVPTFLSIKRQNISLYQDFFILSLMGGYY